MNERGKTPDLIKEYLDRVRIRGKSASVEEYAERLTLLSALREELSSLTTKGFFVSSGGSQIESLEAEGPRAPRVFPDYTVLRDDVLIYVNLELRHPPAITVELATVIWEALRENPNLSAVMLAWPGEKFPTICIDSFEVRRYLERGQSITIPETERRPLVISIEQFFDSQFVDWDLQQVQRGHSLNATARGIADEMHRQLVQAFVAEKERTLGLPEKIEAQQKISASDIERLTERIVDIMSQKKIADSSLRELRDFIASLVEA